MSQTQSKRRIDAKHGLFMRSTLILQLRGHTVISFITLYFGSTYSSVPNKRTCTLINFRLFVPHFLTFLLNKNRALFSNLYAYSIYTLIGYWRVDDDKNAKWEAMPDIYYSVFIFWPPGHGQSHHHRHLIRNRPPGNGIGKVSLANV